MLMAISSNLPCSSEVTSLESIARTIGMFILAAKPGTNTGRTRKHERMVFLLKRMNRHQISKVYVIRLKPIKVSKYAVDNLSFG